MLAVSCTASTIGCMNRLIVLRITNMEIKGIGVPCSKKCASVLWFHVKSQKLLCAHTSRGKAIPRFIES